MLPSSSGRAPWGIFALQLALCVALVVAYKAYWPRHERKVAQQAAATRETKIEALFKNSVETDTNQEVSVSLDGEVVKRHPQTLRQSFGPQDAETMLGVPDSTTTDFRGGQHLTWLGTTHKLEAAFSSGQLYCLTFEDRATGHGVMVFQSRYSWHPF